MVPVVEADLEHLLVGHERDRREQVERAQQRAAARLPRRRVGLEGAQVRPQERRQEQGQVLHKVLVLVGAGGVRRREAARVVDGRPCGGVGDEGRRGQPALSVALRTHAVGRQHRRELGDEHRRERHEGRVSLGPDAERRDLGEAFQGGVPEGRDREQAQERGDDVGLEDVAEGDLAGGGRGGVDGVFFFFSPPKRGRENVFSREK